MEYWFMCNPTHEGNYEYKRNYKELKLPLKNIEEIINTLPTQHKFESDGRRNTK